MYARSFHYSCLRFDPILYGLLVITSSANLLIAKGISFKYTATFHEFVLAPADFDRRRHYRAPAYDRRTSESAAQGQGWIHLWKSGGAVAEWKRPVARILLLGIKVGSLRAPAQVLLISLWAWRVLLISLWAWRAMVHRVVSGPGCSIPQKLAYHVQSYNYIFIVRLSLMLTFQMQIYRTSFKHFWGYFHGKVYWLKAGVDPDHWIFRGGSAYFRIFQFCVHLRS